MLSKIVSTLISFVIFSYILLVFRGSELFSPEETGLARRTINSALQVLHNFQLNGENAVLISQRCSAALLVQN